MPESRYCANCGAELPEIEHEESPEAIERKRPSRRALNWLVDLVPGAFLPKVLVASLAALVASAVVGAFALSILRKPPASWGGPMAILFFAPIGLLGLLAYACGLGWLMCGRLCTPLEAHLELRVKHWLFAVLMTGAAVGLLVWVV